MLSDEEKKAIKELKHFKELTRYWQEEEYEEKEIAGYIETILNLIKKQSKEIEELKEKNRQGKMRIVQLENEITARIEDVNKYFTPNDKIKAKIEEYDDKGMTVNLSNRSAGKTFQQAVHYEVKKALQSLLEKE